MWKLRIGVLVIGGMLLLVVPGAGAASGANSGDVWLDNVKQPAGPGHEMDPHLACQDIDLWGAGLADSSGTFTLDGWSPSGSQELDYSGAWSYTPAGDRTIAVISVSKLIAQAEANGDAGTAQGFHFKLEFSQDPQKHKTFWVDCPGSTTGGGGSNTGGGGSNAGGGGSNTGGGSPPAGGGNDPSPPPGGSGTRPATGSSGGPVFRSIGAVTARRPRHPTHKRHRLVHPARHRRAHRRHVKAARVGTPPFTG
jgi:hypothetical protein